MGYLERRRERYRRHGPVLYLFPAVLWLTLVWFVFFFGAVFASDSGTPEALRASAWMFYVGFLLGLAPLLAVLALLIRRKLNPPVGLEPPVGQETQERQPINWRLSLILLLALIVLLLFGHGQP